MGIFDKLSGKKKVQTSGRDLSSHGRDPEKLYHDAVKLFGQERFRDAAEILEEAAKLAPNSAPIQFTLGATYSRIVGKYGDDEDAVRPWAKKSAEVFRKADTLASQYGGLNDEQLTITRNAVVAFDRIMKREPLSLPEDQRKKIYADFMETKDSELLLGTSLTQDFLVASRSSEGFGQMKQSLKSNAAKAEEAAITKITKKYGIARGQLMAIEEEGKKKKWAFRAVTR